MTGAKVGVQRMQPATGGLAGAQVGVDVRATEGINRLFGVADEEQARFRGVVFDAVDGFEDAVLHRVGVLELIDQRDRELLADQGRQSLTGLSLQCGIEPEQHVIKAHLGTAALFCFKACAHPAGCVLQHGSIRAGQCIQRCFQPCHGVQPRVMRGFALPGFGHAVWCQAGKAGAQIKLLLGLVRRPRAELFKPGFEVTRLHFPTVNGFGGHALQADIA